MRDLTFSDVERLEAAEIDVPFEMDEDAFRAFYDRTARPLWSYLSRMTCDPLLADDLLQESFYRFLRTRGHWESESHRRAYLFRIATNLVLDGRRRARRAHIVPLPDSDHEAIPAAGGDPAEASDRRTDLRRAMDRLRPRERALLWLAYAQGHAHTEIAATLGVKTGSVKLLLFRARRKLAGMLRAVPAPTDGGQS
jgi:RNA polymerase sigma-70 factor (ECF subfamily)